MDNIKEASVCAIVLTYNGKHLIERMLNSLQKTEYNNWKVIVVDNGSSDGSGDLIRQRFPEIDLLKLKPNRGFAGGNNVGTEYALKKYRPQYIVWLNDDMEIVDKYWLRVLVETAKRTNAGIVGCKLLLPDGRIQYAGGYFHPFRITFHRGLLEPDKGQYQEECEVDYANGACFLISKKVLDRVGLLDEKYSPIYFEEADYCARACKAGFKIVYTGKTGLIHHTSSTTKKEGSTERYYIWEKNRIRFVQQNFSFFWRIPAYFRIILGMVWVGNHIHGKGTTIGKRFQLLRKAWGESLN